MSRTLELVLVLATLSLVHTAHGHLKTFSQCQLSRELLRYNFPRSLIPNWVCLIEHASGRATDKVTNHNNSYTSYGLFQEVGGWRGSRPFVVAFQGGGLCPAVDFYRQMMMNEMEQCINPGYKIHNKEWCKKGRKGGHCNMKCEDLINEDLADDVRCAKRIYDRVGFKAWPSSYSYCKEKALPDLTKC